MRLEIFLIIKCLSVVKKIICFLVFAIHIQVVIAQRVVNNIYTFDLDDIFKEVDTNMLKSRLKNVACYKCRTESFNKDSCLLRSIKEYDESGQLIRLTKFSDTNQRFITSDVSFRKVADTLYEAIAKYPLNSDEISGCYFIDTIVKGKAKSILLYKKDKNNKVYVKSFYFLDSDGNLKFINRHDINGMLLQIYYPFGSQKPVSVSGNTIVRDFDSVVTVGEKYVETEFLTTYIYNRKGKLNEKKNLDSTFENGKKSLVKYFYFYNGNNQLVKKITTDEDNRFLSEGEFF